MLQNIRDKSSSWVVKVIIGFIVVTFALFGLDAIVGAFTGGGDEVATVNDRKISRYDLEVATQRQVRQVLAQLGPDADPSSLNENLIRQRALQQLIDREAAVQAATDAGLAVSELQIDRLILATPEFRGADGKFSPDQFNAMLRNVGLQPMQFREELKKDVLINQLQGGVTLSSFLPPKYTNRLIALDSQLRDISYIELNPVDQRPDITDEEVNRYYQENPQQFTLPERVRLQFVQIDQKTLAEQIEPDAAAVEAAYQDYVRRTEGQTQVYAAHIMLETESRSEDAAKQLLLELKQQLESGADFAKVAQEYSEDVGSAADGGALGMVEPGSFDPAFEQALFSLEESEISEPVVTDFGVHLITVTRKERAQPEPFAVMKDELTDQLQKTEAAKRYVTLSEELANAAFAAEDLTSVARELNLSLQETELFSAKGGEGIAANPKVIRAAFSDLIRIEGENSDLIELNDQTAVIVRAIEVKDSTLEPLADVSERIHAILLRQKQLDAVQEQVSALLATRDNRSLEEIAQQEGMELRKAAGISRVDQTLPTPVVQHLFSQPEGSVTQVTTGDTVYIVQINQVSQPDLGEEMQKFYQQAIQLSANRSLMQQLRSGITQAADIQRL